MEGKDLISNVFLVHESTPKKTSEVSGLVKDAEATFFKKDDL